MSLSAFAASSITRLKLMENYAIASPERITVQAQNLLSYDLLTEDLLRQLDDLTSGFALTPQNYNANSECVRDLYYRYAALNSESKLFNEHPDEISVILSQFSEHLQRLVYSASEAIDALDHQAARSQHEAKLAFDIDKFRLEKIAADLREQLSRINRVVSACSNAYTSQQEAARAKFVSHINRNLTRLQDFIFRARGSLVQFDAVSKMFLDISCDLCRKRNDKANIPLIMVPCGHGLCYRCAKKMFDCDSAETVSLSNAKCPQCKADVSMLCPDRAMAKRLQEYQLDSADAVHNALEVLQECYKIVQAFDTV